MGYKCNREGEVSHVIKNSNKTDLLPTEKQVASTQYDRLDNINNNNNNNNTDTLDNHPTKTINSLPRMTMKRHNNNNNNIDDVGVVEHEEEEEETGREEPLLLQPRSPLPLRITVIELFLLFCFGYSK